MDKLNTDILEEIFKHLDSGTLEMAKVVCKKWKNVMGARSSWSAADHGPHLSITVPRVPFNHPQTQ